MMAITLPGTVSSSRSTAADLSQVTQDSRLRELFFTRIASTSTRGIDRLSPQQFSPQLAEGAKVVREKFLNGGYRFAPYLESLRLKSHDKRPRVISIPTVRDRLALLVLKEVLHAVFPDCIARRLPNELIRNITTIYTAGFRGSYVKCDIKEFYDSIDQSLLLTKLSERLPPDVVRLIERAIRNPTATTHHPKPRLRLRPLSRGVPQGLAISNILAEIYLHEADSVISAQVTRYIRYVDDILLFVDQSKRGESYEFVKQSISAMRLTLAPEKHRTGDIGDRFEYLGYAMNLPHVSVRELTVSRFVDSLAGQFTRFTQDLQQSTRRQWLSKSAREAVFIDELNERITGAVSENRRYGWIFYFLEIDDQTLLHNLDHVIGALWSRFIRTPPPTTLKRLARAYWEARFNQLGSYVHNYNQYKTLTTKLDFLVQRGVLDPKSGARHKPADIERLFAQYRARALSRLDADVGVIS